MSSAPRPRVLMVEDEMCLAMVLNDLLEDSGYSVVGAGRIADATRLAEEDFDAAILDINIGGYPVYPVAQRLRERGVPFVFASAYGNLGMPLEFCGTPMLQKPYSADALVNALGRLLDH
jgi:DNA-binding response OmpR family regulator